MAKRKKHILTFKDEQIIDIVGICSHHSDYRLVWGINEKIGLKLSKCEEDYQVLNKKGEVISSHPMYSFDDEMNRLIYYFVKNKQLGHYLIDEKPKIDYFIFLYDNNAIELERFVEELKSVNSVLAAYHFPAEEISSIDNLVFN